MLLRGMCPLEFPIPKGMICWTLLLKCIAGVATELIYTTLIFCNETHSLQGLDKYLVLLSVVHIFVGARN